MPFASSVPSATVETVNETVCAPVVKVTVPRPRLPAATNPPDCATSKFTVRSAGTATSDVTVNAAGVPSVTDAASAAIRSRGLSSLAMVSVTSSGCPTGSSPPLAVAHTVTSL